MLENMEWLSLRFAAMDKHHLMRLLVVTPTLGTSPWLGETVQSVAVCASGAAHVLVAPPQAVCSLQGAYPGVKVIPEPSRGGMYAAINAGLAAVPEWDAFTYLNDDDLLLPGFVELQAKISQMRGATMAYGRVRLIDSRGNRLGGIPISVFPEQNRVLYACRLEPVYQHGTVVSRAAWLLAGPFDEKLKFCGDTDYLARLCLGGVSATFVEGEVAAFRLRAGQLTKQREVMIAERRKVDAKLNLLDGAIPLTQRWQARLLFRSTNWRLYAERLRRHGWKRFDAVLEAAGQE